jgi:hypothetical protein
VVDPVDSELPKNRVEYLGLQVILGGRNFGRRGKISGDMQTGTGQLINKYGCNAIWPGEILMQDEIAALFAYDRWAIAGPTARSSTPAAS